MTIPAPTIRLLVCGSADRGDDGAALSAVARLLPGLGAEIRGHLEIRRCVQLDVSDIVDVPAGVACIVLDTVVGIEPGEVVTMSLPELSARAGTMAPRSSHALPIDQVLGIAEAVRPGLPPGAFVGIGGHWFGFGTMQSRLVRAGLPRLQAAIADAINGLLVLGVA
jgi:Ni,Fe-hydrogenase maturation factor